MKNTLQELLDKPKWTREEKQWLLTYFEMAESDEDELRGLMLRQFQQNQHRQIDPILSKKLLGSIHERIGITTTSKKTPVIGNRVQMLVAACFIGLLVSGIYFWLKPEEKKSMIANGVSRKISKTFTDDVAPGGNKAMLTLADGTRILLDDARDGTLAQQGSTKVLKLQGKLAYNPSKSTLGEVLYNTISTPRGGEYQIELPDGSKVWLNAASSLRFPTAFTGKERNVEITGEAYFEVAKNKAMPFIVKVQHAEIQVLGTQFNVMGYKEEADLKTTLLEGSVKFVSGGINNILKPGQQSLLTRNGQVRVDSDIDVDEAVSWKNGLFHFESDDIETVMRQLSRWYDVEVVYESKKIDDRFHADIPRNIKLSDVLKALELTGKVHFNIEGKKIIVMP